MLGGGGGDLKLSSPLWPCTATKRKHNIKHLVEEKKPGQMFTVTPNMSNERCKHECNLLLIMCQMM